MIGSVNISAETLALIRQEAEAASPAECCGLLVGGTVDEDAVIAQVVPAENQAPDPHRFLIDPQLQFNWMRKLRGSSQSIIGHYHSHPNGVPEPSEYDGQMSHDVGQIWLIVAVVDGVASEVRAFVSQGGAPKFMETPVKVLS